MTGTSGQAPAGSATDHVTQLVTMTFAPEHEDDFLKLAASVVAQVRANEPGTLLYVLTKDPERDHTYVWIERYRDQQALARHGEAPYMADALAKLPGWWSAPPSLVQLREIASI